MAVVGHLGREDFELEFPGGEVGSHRGRLGDGRPREQDRNIRRSPSPPVSGIIIAYPSGDRAVASAITNAEKADFWLERAGRPGKSTRVLALMRRVFGPAFENFFGDGSWGEAADRIARFEAANFSRTLAQRIADKALNDPTPPAIGRRPRVRKRQGPNYHDAARKVAEDMIRGWVLALQAGAAYGQPSALPAAAALNRFLRKGDGLLDALTTAVYYEARPWLRKMHGGPGRWARPVIRGRAQDPVRSAEFRDTLRAALRDPSADGQGAKIKVA